MDAGQDIVSVDFLVPNVHRCWVRPKVSACGTVLLLTIVAPPVFYDLDRLLAAISELTTNTHKATAFANVAERVLCTENEMERY